MAAYHLEANAYVPNTPLAGQVFWVGNSSVLQGTASGSNGNSGLSKEQPFASLVYALTQCTAGRNDTIYLLPGHAETATGAAFWAMSGSGVRVIGLGTGALRPTLSFTTAAAASLDISGANCLLENVVLSCGIDQQTAMVNVTAADVTIRNCEFRMTATLTATNYALLGILTSAAANRLQVLDCVMTGSGAGAAAGTVRHTNAIQIVGGDGIKISGGQIRGRFSATLGNIQVVTTATTNLTVENLYLTNSTTSASKVIVDTVTGSTGLVNNCRMQILSGTAPVTGATMSWGLNYYLGTIAGTMTTL